MFEVVRHPHDVLSATAQPVTAFDDELKKLVDAMTFVLYASDGVGLAAPQINVSRRVVLIDPSSGEAANQLLVLINPRVTWVSPETAGAEEGCLSVPGVRLQVQRALAVDVEYHDMMGTVQRLASRDAMQARIIQHEVDHLDGVMMMDRVGPLARRMAMKGNR